jgi:EpsI family protein
MTLQAHRFLAIAGLVAGLLAYRSLAFWTPDPHAHLSIQDWLFSPVDALPQMYFALAVMLVYRHRRAFRSAMSAAGLPIPALLALSVGSALFVWGHYVAATDLLLVSFAFVSMGVALLWFGTGCAREWSVPCVALAFAYPVPAVLTNQVFYHLRLWTADQSTALLTWVGFPAYHEGNVIHGPNVVAQVIDSCAGLRAIEMLTLATFLFVQWSPAGRLRGWLLVALAPLTAYVFNLLRVCTIVPDPTSDLSATHTVQGWIAFIGGFTFLVLVDRLLGRLLPSRAESAEPAEVAADPPLSVRDALARASARAPGWSLALAVLLMTLLGVSCWAPRWRPPETEASARAVFGVGPSVILPAIGDWKMGPMQSLDLDYFWTVRYSQYAKRTYRRGDETVDLFLGYGDRSDRTTDLLSPKNALPGRGWQVESRGFARLDAPNIRVERVVARSGTQRVLTYHWYEGMDSVALEALREFFATDQSPLRRSQRPRVIRIGTPLEAGAHADRTLRAFAADLAKALRSAPTRPVPRAVTPLSEG